MEDRSFRTRIEFIHDIFSQLYDRSVIMASCVRYKLGRSYDLYLKDLSRSEWLLNNEDPMKVLRRIDVSDEN